MRPATTRASTSGWESWAAGGASWASPKAASRPTEADSSASGSICGGLSGRMGEWTAGWVREFREGRLRAGWRRRGCARARWSCGGRRWWPRWLRRRRGQAASKRPPEDSLEARGSGFPPSHCSQATEITNIWSLTLLGARIQIFVLPPWDRWIMPSPTDKWKLVGANNWVLLLYHTRLMVKRSQLGCFYLSNIS